jgi:hypothetical protein
MKARLVIDIDEFRSMMKFLRTVNEYDPDSIKIISKGVELPIDPQAVEEWKFIGLNTTWFIETHFLKDETK